MNRALSVSKQMIYKHGITVTYSEDSNQVYDPATGQVTYNQSNYSLKSYPKQLVANQYNFPDLIGKEMITFYFDGETLTSIKLGAVITHNSRKYKVVSYSHFMYEGTIYLYKVNSVAI